MYIAGDIHSAVQYWKNGKMLLHKIATRWCVHYLMHYKTVFVALVIVDILWH